MRDIGVDYGIGNPERLAQLPEGAVKDKDVDDADSRETKESNSAMASACGEER